MANPWFRFYTDFISNPKVQILSESLRCRYVTLLCLKCNGSLENSPNDEIALSLRVTVEEWELTKKEFIKRKLITEKGEIVNWEKRQYISDLKDPTAAERQKAYRKRKVISRNATVTSRLPEADTDTETETEIKKTKAKKSPPVTLPDFIPENEWQEFKAHRKSIKKPLGERAEKLAIGELTKLHKSGEDLKTVINTSIFNGWAGLFAVKQNFTQKGRQTQINEKNISVLNKFINEKGDNQ